MTALLKAAVLTTAALLVFWAMATAVVILAPAIASVAVFLFLWALIRAQDKNDNNP